MINTVCAGCGYRDPLPRPGHPDAELKHREALMLHSRYTGRCPVTGDSIDPPVATRP